MALYLRAGLIIVTDSSNIAILIPAYNASATLAEVVRRCRNTVPNLPIVVVDDGSTDATARVGEENECHVLSHPENRGKGAALKTGFAYASEQHLDAAITLDADLQHAPESIPAFLAAYASGRHDLLVGTRTISRQVMPVPRVLSNGITSWMISRLIGQRITDSQCGFRLITAPVLRLVELETNGYELESELLIKTGRLGFRIGLIPIETIYQGRKSHIRPLLDVWRFARLVGRSL